jgi:hypothetical protein
MASPRVSRNAGFPRLPLAQVTAASRTVLKLCCLPRVTPPYVLSYNALSVPILQLAFSSKRLPKVKLCESRMT